MLSYQVQKRGNRRDPNEVRAGAASDTDSALEDSGTDSDNESDSDPDQPEQDQDRPGRKGKFATTTKKDLTPKNLFSSHG